MVMRARCGRRPIAWRRAFRSTFSLSPTGRGQSGPRHLKCENGAGRRQCGRGGRLDCRALSAADVRVTSDIPLGSLYLKKGARVVSPTGKQWTQANIGNALVGREIARHLRELGANTRGPAPLTKKDRSGFLSALDTAVQAALREAARG